MVAFVALVVILVAATYAFSIADGRSGPKQKQFEAGNPFRGRHEAPPPKPRNHTIDKGSMTRCHNCACFFPSVKVVNDVVEGHVLEFCSQDCKRAFLKPGR